jgi:hypothetical protein
MTPPDLTPDELLSTTRMHEVPLLVIPCIEGRTESMPFMQQAVTWGSIMPAVWGTNVRPAARKPSADHIHWDQW